MHDCANCGQACYCDGDDLPCPTPEACAHECQEAGDDFYEWIVHDGDNGAQARAVEA